MAKIAIKNNEGGEAGTLELADAVFGVEPNDQCVRSALHHFAANARAGTHSTKTRAKVRGGGRKPWRQKGTGRARQGSIRAIQWRGGGIAFGPHPRDYSYRLNRRVKRNALRSVLSELVRSERLMAIEEFGIEEPKTHRLVEILGKLELKGSTLIISESADRALVLSARNLPSVECTTVESANIHQLLTHDRIVATRAALERMAEVFA